VTQYSIFAGHPVPAATADTGAFQAGTIWETTADAIWLDGYRWPVAASGQQLTGYTFAIWQPIDATHQTLVPGSAVSSSGSLTAGAYNTVLLPAPIGLSKLVPYTVVCGFTSSTGFPFLASQFGSGQPLDGGITNGPLFAWSDGGSLAPPPASQSQGLFGTGAASGGSASANYPNLGSDGGANFFADIIADTVAPAGAQLQLWPSQPTPVNVVLDDTTGLGSVVTVTTEIALSAPAVLNKLLIYSIATCTSLPTKTAVLSIPGGSVVPGSLNSSPSWSGAAGSGWVSVNYALTLPAGKYWLAVSAPAGKFNSSTSGAYWSGAGPGATGIANGILSAPNNASATSPGQSSFAVAADLAAPTTNAGNFTYWVDGLFTPVPPSPAAGGGLPDAGDRSSFRRLLVW